ncbi:ribosomal-protein (S5)-alanine N-acetyltransferase [Tepidicaulis marinus]|uniref:Ribosomal-protein (S5)-alanine N-acetyltransferase n=1 Tax=Tepidicaulis marinus TaxID=1333998 RepID=A0A081BEM6_9HYPH|nr:GNAT family protein [Tepidicaulis marinus]GAK46494.1 ribosomal-protein (S5)-alanine N-acetyltransferase [Tepidicaulis marinus]
MNWPQKETKAHAHVLDARRGNEIDAVPGNTRSIRLLERHGFEKEGLLRQHAYWKGRFWDQLIFGQVLQGNGSGGGT